MKAKYINCNELTISRKDIELPYTPGLAYQFTTHDYVFLIHTKPAYYCKYNLWRADSDFIVINCNQLNALFTPLNIYEAVYDKLTHKQNNNFLIQLIDKQIEFANKMVECINHKYDYRLSPYHLTESQYLIDSLDQTPKRFRDGVAAEVRPRSEKQYRNALCRCGSGRKYKHCCYLKSNS